MKEPMQRPYTVSQFTHEIKRMLEGTYPNVFLEGEISNFKVASSGHWYFSIKDEQAMVQAIMFRGAQQGKMPTDGQMVRVHAGLSVYAKRGNYQLICTSIEGTGEGRILQMLEERKRRLAAEGLFAQEHKKPLPFFPKRLIILSSDTGAAVRDILHVIKRRAAWLNLCVVNIPVQGEEAGKQIARRLTAVEQLGDVIILSRGGGSLEDLLPFNDEALIRAIHRCTPPLISAIGHEIDWTLSDLVADLRAPTPSAAAEMLCNNAEELRLRILTAGRILIQAFTAKRERLSLALKPFRKEVLEQSFRNCIQPKYLVLDDKREGLIQEVHLFIRGLRQHLHLVTRELIACDPYTILKRGYTIVRNTDQVIIGHSREAQAASQIYVQFHDGEISAKIHNTDSLRNAKHEKF